MNRNKSVLKVLQIGAKNFPPAHGGTERLVYDLVQGMPTVESHVLVDQEYNFIDPRLGQLPEGFLARWKTIIRFARDKNIDVIHIHKSSNIPLALALKISGLKCILTVHGCVWRRGERRWSPITKAAFWLLDYLACMSLDRVVLVGDHDWLSFKSYFPKKRLSIIPNGVSMGEEPGQLKKSGWVYIGRISSEKNILNLICATKILQEKLTLFGPISPPNARFEKAFKSMLENSNVVWKGPIAADSVRATLSHYKVFINPSFTEGLPFTVLEAAAEGMYLVLSDIRPHRLLNFPACSYINPDNIDLSNLSNKELNGEANRAHVINNFSIENMLKGYLDIYQTLK